jgi:hypothetical protein
VSDTNYVQKYVQMCLRMAAECEGLAANVPSPDLRAHFFHMASMWTELAAQPHVETITDDKQAAPYRILD